MTSAALAELRSGLKEINALQRANPTPAAGGGLTRPEVTRAIGRAEVVLLCSHLEYFVYSLVDLAAEAVFNAQTVSQSLPTDLRLLQSRAYIDEAAVTSWERREGKLTAIAGHVAPMWTENTPVGMLDAKLLLAQMKTPDPPSLVRAFRPWGIPDVFRAITRTEHHRSRLWLKLQELADKRNNIAHGDFTEEATYLDVASYKRAVKDFGERVDGRVADRVMRIAGLPARPW